MCLMCLMFRNPEWAIPEKIQTGGLWTYFLENIPGIIRFIASLHLKIPDITKFHPGNSTSFLIKPWNFTCYFFDTFGTSMASPPPPPPPSPPRSDFF